MSAQVSSARFKENVEPLDGDFHRVLSLSPRRFLYRDSGEHSIGYLAEEADELQLRDLVGYDGDGRPLNVNYKTATARRQAPVLLDTPFQLASPADGVMIAHAIQRPRERHRVRLHPQRLGPGAERRPAERRGRCSRLN